MSDLTPEQQERFLHARSLSRPETIRRTLADLEAAASGQGDADLARLCAGAATTIRSLHDQLGTERALAALEDRNYAQARERALHDARGERRMTDDDRDALMGLSDDAIGQGGRLPDERQVELGRLALRAWAEVERLRAQRKDDRERVLLLIAEAKRVRTIVRGSSPSIHSQRSSTARCCCAGPVACTRQPKGRPSATAWSSAPPATRSRGGTATTSTQRTSPRARGGSPRPTSLRRSTTSRHSSSNS